MLLGIPCVLMRGGASKGLFFLASDLPADSEQRDRVLLAAMGSPDARQIDGMGGGDELSSKVVIVYPAQRPGVDLEYLFAQVSVSGVRVDTLPNSGNMLAGVAPFAIERGLLPAGDPATHVRLYNRNTGSVVEVELQTPGGAVATRGDFHLDGVPGASAPIRLRFLNAAGATTGRLLPTGKAVDRVLGTEVSCVDFANPIVFVKAAALGRSGHESKQELDADGALLARLEAIRCAAANLMGLGDVAGKGLPKIVLVAPPRRDGNIASRYFVPASCHAAHAVTGSICLAAACHIPGSVAAAVVRLDPGAPGRLVIEHPTGSAEAQLLFEAGAAGEVPAFASASIVTTSRPLLTGQVFVPDRVLQGAARREQTEDPAPPSEPETPQSKSSISSESL